MSEQQTALANRSWFIGPSMQLACSPTVEGAFTPFMGTLSIFARHPSCGDRAVRRSSFDILSWGDVAAKTLPGLVKNYKPNRNGCGKSRANLELFRPEKKNFRQPDRTALGKREPITTARGSSDRPRSPSKTDFQPVLKLARKTRSVSRPGRRLPVC